MAASPSVGELADNARDGGDKDDEDARAVQLIRGDSARCDWIPPRSSGTTRGFVRTGLSVAQSPHRDRQAAAVPSGDQPARRKFAAGDVPGPAIKRQRLGRRRGSDDGPVCARVLESDVTDELDAGCSFAPGHAEDGVIRYGLCVLAVMLTAPPIGQDSKKQESSRDGTERSFSPLETLME